jgi:hypothetical protein
VRDLVSTDDVASSESGTECRLWTDHSGIAVKPFRYLHDPLFLGCCALYAANRWAMKPHFHGAFVHSWFNDALLIPCALPVVLIIHAWLGWRELDAMPGAREILAHLVGWSVLFEVIGPRLMHHPTGDVLDVAAYAAGAAAAYVWWHRARLRPAAIVSHEL